MSNYSFLSKKINPLSKNFNLGSKKFSLCKESLFLKILQRCMISPSKSFFLYEANK